MANFSSNAFIAGRIKSREIMAEGKEYGAGQRPVLKVYDIENSTQGYNLHHILRRGSNGCYVLAEKPYNLCPANHYLVIVLAWYEGQYATWYENLELGGFHGGHYYAGDFEGAFKDFLTRGSNLPFDLSIAESDDNESEDNQ